MIRIVVAEDHTLVRQTLIKTLSTEPGFEVVGEAGRGDEALQVIQHSRPELALMDISMPGMTGLEVAARLRAEGLETRILFLTMYDDDASITRAMSLGAAGYVLKSASTDELLKAIRAVAANGSYLTPTIAKRVIDMASSKGSSGALTERELEVLQLLAEGSRPPEVAAKLYISLKTVKNHITSIYAKLGVHSGTQAVAEAFRRGLVGAVTAD